jgi:REP element-mobilizing transposase RayT
MRDICLSFEWRLEMLSIRPEYMHWVFFVPANTPPSQCVRIVREQTSRRIFREIPHIRRENMSPDFWAPGYLVRMGPTPYTADMIADFVRLIRQHQGIQPRPSV